MSAQYSGWRDATSKPAPSPAAIVRNPENPEAFNWSVWRVCHPPVGKLSTVAKGERITGAGRVVHPPD